MKLFLALLVLHLGSLKVRLCLNLYLHSCRGSKSFLSFEPLSLQILSLCIVMLRYGWKIHYIHYTIPKQYRTLLELLITQRQLESPGKQLAAQLTIWNKSLRYFTTTSKQCVSVFCKDDMNFFFLANH